MAGDQEIVRFRQSVCESIPDPADAIGLLNAAASSAVSNGRYIQRQDDSQEGKAEHRRAAGSV
jgi:hypothetical protein